jgi:predicted nucleotidyltransferase
MPKAPFGMPYRVVAIMDVDRLAHLKPEERAALGEYVERLEARFGDRILQVILFGSRARGEGDAESDLDVLVVVDDGDWRFHDEVASESWEPSLATGATISPHIWSQSRYERQKQMGLLFYRNVERDGITVWTRTRKSLPSTSDSKEPKTTSKLPA